MRPVVDLNFLKGSPIERYAIASSELYAFQFEISAELDTVTETSDAQRAHGLRIMSCAAYVRFFEEEFEMRESPFERRSSVLGMENLKGWGKLKIPVENDRRLTVSFAATGLLEKEGKATYFPGIINLFKE